MKSDDIKKNGSRWVVLGEPFAPGTNPPASWFSDRHFSTLSAKPRNSVGSRGFRFCSSMWDEVAAATTLTPAR
jgi:hypothetical protein